MRPHGGDVCVRRRGDEGFGRQEFQVRTQSCVHVVVGTHDSAHTRSDQRRRPVVAVVVIEWVEAVVLAPVVQLCLRQLVDLPDELAELKGERVAEPQATPLG